MHSKKLWATILAALAAAILAIVTALQSGCSCALQGQLVSWGATVGKEPPEVPAWGTALTNGADHQPTTRPTTLSK